ncbi:non-structural maintenance of chromosomes element 1 homolog [Watersipora subatra]|uniref:non-structural maintenance of chromosomes element 1 homolog n=1 Tax=Watersipora subatra TaxID=2589382 RepID=UPI00355AE964
MASQELSSSQKMFLQSIAHAGFMDASTVKSRYKACREHFGEDAPVNEIEALRDFIKAINTHLRRLDLEVKKGIEEDTGRPCYVFINSVDNTFLMAAGKYTVKQMHYFSVLLKLIVMSEEGCITVVDALNAVDSLEFKMSKADASQLIHQAWHMSDKWLKGVRPFGCPQQEEEEDGNTMLTLGSRSILELERYMRDTYSDYVKDCNICNRLCIRGLLCEGCDCKTHVYCLRSYLRKKKDPLPVCPNKSCSRSRPELSYYQTAT